MNTRAGVKTRLLLAAVVLLAVGCAACNRDQSASNAPASHVAIRSAIEKHLRRNAGINMAAMSMTVDSVSLHEDQAQANVTFRLNDAGTTMQMTYFLSRHANDWIVLRSQPAGGQFTHPPMDETHRGTPASPRPRALPNISDFFPPNAADRNSSSSSPPSTSSPRQDNN